MDLLKSFTTEWKQPTRSMSLVFQKQYERMENSKDLARKSEEARGSLRARIQQIMNLTIDREMERLEKNMSFLASVGSTAPFVGLFGTVWGIMDAFQAIAATKTTALSVVAPGIARSLIRNSVRANCRYTCCSGIQQN